jgi:hypothetical protein
MVLVFSRIPVGIHEIRKAGSMASDRVPQDFAYGVRKPRRLAPGDGSTAALRVNLRKEQRFANINISKPGNLPLIQKKRLYFLPAFPQLRFKPAAIETRVQWISAQRSDFWNHAYPRHVIHRHESKPARIAILQLREIGELDNDMCMFASGFRTGMIQNSSAHSQMDQPECTRIERDDEVFSAPRYAPYGSTPKIVLKPATQRSAERKS